MASKAETHQTIDTRSGMYGKDTLQLMEAKETNIVKTHNPPTLKHSQKSSKETLTCRASSHFGRSGGRSLALGHAPCVCFPEGRYPPPSLARTQREATFAPPSPAGARRDSSCACALRRWAPKRDRRPPESLLCACALALPPSRCARLSQSVCRSLSSEQEERRDF